MLPPVSSWRKKSPELPAGGVGIRGCGTDWAPSPLPPLQLQPVGDHGDELGVGGFALGIADGEAEVFLQGVQVTPVPGDFDGVAPNFRATSG